MDAYAYYLGSATLFGLSSYLFKGTAPWSELGCTQYDKARIVRLAAVILLVLAMLLLGVGVFTQTASASVSY